jgi:hypothetical protein
MALARLTLLESAAFLNDVTNAAIYKVLLTAATKAINRHCNREFEKATYTSELYYGNGEQRLYLREYPVITLGLSVKIWDGYDSYDAVTATHYEPLEGRYIQYPKLGQESSAVYARWPLGRPIQVTYDAGYDTAATAAPWDTCALTTAFAAPADLEYACAALAALMWRRKAVSGIASESMGPRSISYADMQEEIPPEIVELLKPYRRIDL